MVKHIEEGKLYSEAVVHNGVAYLCGQIAWNKPGADFEAQTKDTFQCIDEALEAAGTDKSKILSVTVYLRDLKTQYDAFNTLYLHWLEGCKRPARACVEAKPVKDDYLLELVIIAAV